ncbi:hypothetical protein THRCLA_06591 [Thraustotheca clavata]|uniref:PH domain-containing protein n=1 Tax=Thraustotheca clavata TaxID=74557 RepID=A0A1V9ZMF3_9STRA|nr:hypothetical protein THRCLA_06591 [Thraustotheca clavata]
MSDRSTFSGWLRIKRATGFMNVWKQRFFVLKNTTLYEYQSEATFSGGHKATRRVTSVQLVPSLPLTFLVSSSSGKKQSFYLSAFDSASFKHWNEAFNESCVPIVLDDEPRPSGRTTSNVESITSSSTTMPVMCGDHIHHLRASSKVYKPILDEKLPSLPQKNEP